MSTQALQSPAPSRVLRIWQRLPVVMRAVLSGITMGLLGSIPWLVLSGANQRHLRSVPWAVLPMSLYLWGYWRYAGGSGWPAATRDARRINRRRLILSEDMWGAALVAGIAGLLALVAFLRVVNRLVELPQQSQADLSHFPGFTLFGLLLMATLVSGVVEEVSFRGYMQRPIEERHGPIAAILVTGVIFGFAHFGHPEVTLRLLPYYLAVAAVYGSLAYFTNSVLPSMFLHVVGNAFSYLRLFAAGTSEWQATDHPRRLIWDGGTDASFWISVAISAALALAAVWAYTRLAHVARIERSATLRATGLIPET